MAVQTARPNILQRMTAFVHQVAAEMRKVTWPDRGQIRNATIGIMIFVLFVGAIITLMDIVLQWILVRLLPSIFA